MSDLAVLTLYTESTPAWSVWPREDKDKAVHVTAKVRQFRLKHVEVLECSSCRRECKHIRAVKRHRKVMEQ